MVTADGGGIMKAFQLVGPERHDLAAGTYVLEASAGTGKTYTITGIVLRLILEQDIKIEQCLLMTFTRAATAELRERIRQVLNTAMLVLDGQDPGSDGVMQLVVTYRDDAQARFRLHSALINLDTALMSTIHGVCHRILQEHALDTGMSLQVDMQSTDQERWREQQLADLVRQWARQLHPASAALLGKAFAMQALNEKAKLVDQHPHLHIEGVDALSPTAVNQMVKSLAEQWPSHTADMQSFFETHAKQLTSKVALNKILAAIDRISAHVADVPAGHLQLADFLLLLDVPVKKGKERPPIEETSWYPFVQRIAYALDSVQRALIEAYRERLLQRYQDADELSFNDLIVALQDAVHGPQAEQLKRAMRQRYQVILVDEFQDTDDLQWDILSQLFDQAGKRLFLIGDPKQAIYSFRGADIHTYLHVVSLPHIQRFTLHTNFRSDQPLVAAINNVFQVEHSFVDQAIQFSPVDAVHPLRFRFKDKRPTEPLQWITVEAASRKEHSKRDMADVCAKEIAYLLAHAECVGADGKWRQVVPHDIAILVANHSEAKCMAEALAAQSPRINATRMMRSSVFSSTIATDVLLLLRTIFDPGSQRKIRTAAVTRLVGLSIAELQQEPISEACMQYISRLRILRDVWLEKGFVALWMALLSEGVVGIPLRQQLVSFDDGERHITDVLHLGDVLMSEVSKQHLGAESLLRYLETSIADPNQSQDELLQRLDRDDHAVQIMTVHVSKGLEFPICFVPFAWGGKRIKTDLVYHKEHQACYYFGALNEADASRYYHEQVAERMRLLYVALTRAQHRCYLGCAWQSGVQHSALHWLAYGALHEAHDASMPGQKEFCKTNPMDDYWQSVLLHDGAAELSAHPETTTSAVPINEQSEQPSAAAVQPWQAVARSRWFSSYSGLIRNRPVDEPDYDQLHQETETAERDNLPRGAQFGTAVHAVFEFVDFQASLADIEAEAHKRLDQQSLDTVHAAATARMVHGVLQAKRLQGHSLAEIAQQRFAELEVLLPVTDSRDIAAVFAAHGGEWAAYAADIAGMSIPPGFFTGIIDLVFEHDGRYHVLDWKTNDLSTKGGYGSAPMAQEMRHHHYILQYHLYMLALHRFLRLRLKGYQYETHMGAAHYVFVRGISDADGESAWFTARPSVAMMEALDACFGAMVHA